MRLQQQSSSDKLQNHFIHLHDEEWLTRQRVAGRCHAEVMLIIKKIVEDKSPISLLEVDKITEEEIHKRKCVPTFKGYKGFPNALIVSVNKQLVHGIPSSYKLQDGDVVSFDFGTTFEGAIADAATTMIFGNPKSLGHVKLIEAGKKCLSNAINAIKVGKKTGVIGNTIHKTAAGLGFRVIESLGGHSLTWNKVHAGLFIPNKSLPEDGVFIHKGLTLAIEPLLVPFNCSNKTILSDDGWTISTHEIGTHEEQTIYIHEDHVEIITEINEYK